MFTVLTACHGASSNTLRMDSRFKEDLGMDSLDGVELVMELEEELQVTIPDDVVVPGSTVKTFVDDVVRSLSIEIPA